MYVPGNLCRKGLIGTELLPGRSHMVSSSAMAESRDAAEKSLPRTSSLKPRRRSTKTHEVLQKDALNDFNNVEHALLSLLFWEYVGVCFAG